MIELGKFISYEFADNFEKKYLILKTKLCKSKYIFIKKKYDLVVINILRAAIPLIEGIMEVFTD